MRSSSMEDRLHSEEDESENSESELDDEVEGEESEDNEESVSDEAVSDVNDTNNTSAGMSSSVNDADVEEGSDDEAEDEEGDGSESDGSDASDVGNAGWADAMSKVLAMGKNSTKEVSILSKAKKDGGKKSDAKKSKSDGSQLQVVNTEGATVTDDKAASSDDSSSGSDDEADSKPYVPLAVRRAKKREIDSVGRVKPDILARGQEKSLAKIATRGVVQLFNAVREQQKSVKNKLKEAGSSRKREKVLQSLDKNSFLDILEGKQPQSQHPVAKKRAKFDVKEEDDKDSTWSVLREDFMLGAKMKDWDKESDND